LRDDHWNDCFGGAEKGRQTHLVTRVHPCFLSLRSCHEFHNRGVVQLDLKSLALLQRNPRWRRFMGVTRTDGWTIRRSVLPVARRSEERRVGKACVLRRWTLASLRHSVKGGTGWTL